jgi:hypothetical protein
VIILIVVFLVGAGCGCKEFVELLWKKEAFSRMIGDSKYI